MGGTVRYLRYILRSAWLVVYAACTSRARRLTRAGVQMARTQLLFSPAEDRRPSTISVSIAADRALSKPWQRCTPVGEPGHPTPHDHNKQKNNPLHAVQGTRGDRRKSKFDAAAGRHWPLSLFAWGRNHRTIRMSPILEFRWARARRYVILPFFVGSLLTPSGNWPVR